MGVLRGEAETGTVQPLPTADDWDGFAATRFVRDEKVVEGRDGFLFMADDNNHVLAQHSGELRLDTGQLEAWRALLERRAETLAQKGCAHLVMVAPNTHSVYPEKLPPGIAMAAERPVHQLAAHLAETGSAVEIMYPLERMIAGKGELLVCSRTDSHWTDFGVFLAYSQLMERVRPLVQTRDLDRSDLLFTEISVPGDLGFKFEPKRHLPQPFARMRYRDGRLVYENGVEGTGCLAVTHNYVAPPSTCLLLADSYGYAMAKFLSESFRRVVFAHAPTLDPALVEATQPDVVVTLIAERFLVSVPDDERGPSLREREQDKRAAGRTRPPLQYWTWPSLLSPGPVELMRARLLAEGRLMEAALVTTMAYGGLRPAEAMALRWSAIGPDAIEVPSLPAHQGTSRGVRRVPLWPPLAADLDAWRRGGGGEGGRRVFVEDGRPMDLRAWRDSTYDKLAREAGLSNRRPAFLRHIFCALLINSGVSVHELSELVDMDSDLLIGSFSGLWEDGDPSVSVPVGAAIARARARASG